jgi:hypothetical protein
MVGPANEWSLSLTPQPSVPCCAADVAIKAAPNSGRATIVATIFISLFVLSSLSLC